MEIESQNMVDNAPPVHLDTSALAHLARHMSIGCPRAAERASLLLERVAAGAETDPHLRAHACELVAALERDYSTPAGGMPKRCCCRESQ
ncbi:MAG: hypothetical protein POELPBGB_04208 [Bacteroidia bacterium]|nr:hypothetical protein [Rubrivivax sp.]MCG3168402.1 hypothetical protein [Bacteroidia bacterium]HNQ57619.1 hypothetical protein [Candidatus Desulfobacillus denitrificans]HNT61730.1 hypothetical protein [Candidatus Desulfobacillus denitrificans]